MYQYNNKHNITVCLSPAEVVTEIGGSGIENNATVEGGWIEEGGGGEETAPVEHKGGGKVGGHCTDELTVYI